MRLPIASRGPSAHFRCPGCGGVGLHRQDSRPSALGAEVQSRLYSCDTCGRMVLTEERVVGLFSKRSLPKSNGPVEGTKERDTEAAGVQTGTE